MPAETGQKKKPVISSHVSLQNFCTTSSSMHALPSEKKRKYGVRARRRKKRVKKRRRTYDVDALLAALFVLCILHIRSFPMLHDDAVSTQDGSPHPPSSTLTTRRALHPSLAAPSGVQPAAVRRMSATLLSKMHGRQEGSRREAADASAFLHFRRPSPPFLHLSDTLAVGGFFAPSRSCCPKRDKWPTLYVVPVRRTGKVDDVWVWAVVGACPL